MTTAGLSLRPAPTPHPPRLLSQPYLPVLVSSEVGQLVLLGHRAPFTLSTHLSLSKVLGHSCLGHGNAKWGGGLPFSLPFAPHPSLQSPVFRGPSPASHPLVWGLGSLVALWHSLIRGCSGSAFVGGKVPK